MTRLLVCLLLQAHPREFRRRFGAEILRDIEQDLLQATARGPLAVVHTSLAAVLDAARAFPRRMDVAGRTTSMSQETTHMRTWLPDALHDLRLGFRGFRRQWAFSLSVIATLALGIGVNGAMYGVADRLLLRGPEHVRDAGAIRRLQLSQQPRGRDVQRSGWFGYVAYDALRQNAKSFDGIAAYNIYEGGAILGRGVDAHRVNQGEATANFFPLLGVTPALGRFYDEHDDDPAAPQAVVVLGYGLWQRDFGGRDNVIGLPVTIDNATYTVIGVAPRAFTGPDLVRVDVWLPESLLGRTRVRNWTGSWNSWWLSLVARMKPGVADSQADAETTSILQHAWPAAASMTPKPTIAVRPLVAARDGSPSMEARVSTWLSAVAAIVLLIACANVVNLMLAHGLARRREFAVRLALGADRGRLVRLLVAESLTLALAGGTAGLGVAYAAGTLMRAWLIPGVEWSGGPVNARVLITCTLVSILAGLTVGLWPALRSSAPDVSSSLKSGIREGGGRRNRVRATLTIVQAALSALLLVGSGLFIVSLSRVRALDLGIQPDRVASFSVVRTSLAQITDEAERQRERERRLGFYPALVERLQQRPDVESASLAIGLAFMGSISVDISVPGLASIPRLKGGGPYETAVTSEYFRTVGTRILRGRGFTAADRQNSAPVTIVNETMARTLWPNEDAIGRCFTSEGTNACAEVVGIAEDTHHSRVTEDPSMAFYVPVGQEKGIGGSAVLVRPRGDAAALLDAVRRDLIAGDSTITFVYGYLLQDQWDPLVRPWELGATMFSLMGALALVVAAGGIYSVMAYFVANRTHEIGVRLALGARPADVVGLIMRGGVGLAGAGLAIGLGVALVAGRFIEPLLYQTSARDPGVFALVALTLIATSAIATLIPATRARRVNPVEAMRTE